MHCELSLARGVNQAKLNRVERVSLKIEAGSIRGGEAKWRSPSKNRVEVAERYSQPLWEPL